MKSINHSITPINIMMSSLIDLASPKAITYLWNIGSMLGLVLMMQIITGLFLSFYYISETMMAFNSVSYIMREVGMGWLFRLIHSNGASLFFLFCYIHMGRGMYYSSYQLMKTWLSGSTIYLLLMGTGFLGYVLPWGQMSLWGAMVITNLISIIPMFGVLLIQWIWGAYSMGTSTLNCFYSLHYLLPLVILMMVVIHMMFLHLTGSSISIGMMNNIIKVKFDLLFTIKDSVNLVMLIGFLLFNLMLPFMLMESDNFIQANPMMSPLHIVPEWYFLYIYAILRSIPNKVMGVVLLCLAIAMIFLLSLLNKVWKSLSMYYKIMFWVFISIFLLLTWLGSQAVETPFINIGQAFTIMYFMSFVTEMAFNNLKEGIM